MHESHGIVVTDLAFLPDRLSGKNIKGNHETAMLSVAVDSRCQVHTILNRSKLRLTFYSTCWLNLSMCYLFFLLFYLSDLL